MLLLSLGLLVRVSGQVSLCHAAFAAIGAVVFAQLAAEHGVPWLLAVLAAGLVAVPVGAARGDTGHPVVRALPRARHPRLRRARAEAGSTRRAGCSRPWRRAGRAEAQLRLIRRGLLLRRPGCGRPHRASSWRSSSGAASAAYCRECQGRRQRSPRWACRRTCRRSSSSARRRSSPALRVHCLASRGFAAA